MPDHLKDCKRLATKVIHATEEEHSSRSVARERDAGPTQNDSSRRGSTHDKSISPNHPTGQADNPSPFPRDFKISLFLGNVPFDCSAVELQVIFQRYGRVLDVYLPTFPGIQKPRGFTFVHFWYEQDAKAAMDVLYEQHINGKVVTVRWAKSKAPSKKHPDNQIRPPPRNKISHSYVVVLADRAPDLPHKITQIIDSIIITNPKAVAIRLWDLQLGLVETPEGLNISILKLIDSIRASSFVASIIDMVRISPVKFLMTLKSKVDLIDFLDDPDLHRKMGLILVVKWSASEVMGEEGRWIRLFGIPDHAYTTRNSAKATDKSRSQRPILRF
ncbi:uncharacterized protein LOC131228862 [Magnolia sinica]|uniref:uncharacterized protein LOC131228862 n=1 Tax=Magnolia sinica TaxID=86752 RepID=UPI00265A398D|nr:uncharacterized protein LOC131228862 [Magnolia sinica]